MVLAAGQSYYLFAGDNRHLLSNLGDDTIDSIVTDPPYELTSISKRFGGDNAAPAKFGSDGAFQRASGGFMNCKWDSTGIAFDPELWAECLRVLKPGGHLLAFSGTRTYHRMAYAIDVAGFEIRDMLEWLYGSGFPKSHDVGNGRGTALKPAHEPICMARKPLTGTVAANVIEWGTGALNIDGCRVPNDEYDPTKMQRQQSNRVTWEGGTKSGFAADHVQALYNPGGRFPANVLHDGSPGVLAGFPAQAGAAAPVRGNEPSAATAGVYRARERVPGAFHGDSGSAARFFYCAKASKADREAGRPEGFDGDRFNAHPTVKPTDLMRWLVRLVTPPGGTVFDPFTGSGSTGRAAILEGCRFIGAELTPEYVPIAHARIDAAVNGR